MLRGLTDHPQRIALVNELHARPFQPARAPGRIVHLAFKPATGAAERDPTRDRDHLIALMDRFGQPHPAPDANHHTVDMGRYRLKWERHTEFVSYTLYEDGAADMLFAGALMDHLPEDWLADAPGNVVAAIQVEVLQAADRDGAIGLLDRTLARAFNGESMASGWVLDDSALVMGDFRIHEGGFTRFAMVLCAETGPRRVGRMVQRLIEIEVYRGMAMLALPIARKTASRLNEIERELSTLIEDVALDDDAAPEGAILSALTELSAEIEALAASAAFRFDAGRAYESIVHERIALLNESRNQGRQMFGEFMLRRFDPAMRTVHAVERRLSSLAVRASRIAELLRTRVNVALEAQNQKLLESMDRRAALQLRLQEMVEGLSVVAISYYAVSLAGYVLAPVGTAAGIDKTTLTALATVPIIALVWLAIRRMRRSAGI